MIASEQKRLYIDACLQNDMNYFCDRKYPAVQAQI